MLDRNVVDRSCFCRGVPGEGTRLVLCVSNGKVFGIGDHWPLFIGTHLMVAAPSGFYLAFTARTL